MTNHTKLKPLIITLILFCGITLPKFIFAGFLKDGSSKITAMHGVSLSNISIKAKNKSQSNTSFPCIADAFIYSGGTSVNNGTGDLVVKCTAASGTYNRLSILKFDLSNVDETKGHIYKAEIQLTIKSSDDITTTTKKNNFNNTIFTANFLKDNSWSENLVTWANYVDIAKSASFISSIKGSEISQTNSAIVPNSIVKWDITDRLRRAYASNNTISIALYASEVAANLGATFYSKEAANSEYVPKIIIYQESDDAFLQPSDLAVTPYDIVMQNVRQTLFDDVTSFTSLSSNAQSYLSTIKANGSWDDIDYSNTAQTDWKPLEHLNRLKTMALAYISPQSLSTFENDDLQAAIKNGLQYWHDTNPLSTNWFNQQIASPQRIGQVLILMRAGKIKLPGLLEIKILGRMTNIGGAPDQSGSQGTGANKLNIALHWIYRGALNEDNAVLDKGVKQAFYPLFYTSGEGFQYDNSYQQHGAQLYIGGYGWDMVSGEANAALYTVGTNYALATDQLELLSTFVKDTYLRAIRGQNFVFNALGRGLSRVNGLSQVGFAKLLDKMKLIDPKNKTDYDFGIARLTNNQPPNFMVDARSIHYYNSDYSLFTKPDFSFEVRGVSTRTLRNENGNNENLLGYFLSDGATCITTNGSEYFNIFPVWDWAMIPGVTSRKLPSSSIPKPAQWGTGGNTSFVGGVSDTTSGITVYDLNNNNTSGKKAWFTMDNEIVCLGAGINSTANEQIYTTINQCLLQSPIILSSNGTTNTLTGNTIAKDYDNDLNWIIQGNVGYILPNGGKIGLTATEQTGKWSTINTSQPTVDVTNDVFKLWINHGVKPNNSSYAYIVVPNVGNQQLMENYLVKDNIQILANNNNIQAVRHRSKNLHSFVFHQANQSFSNDTISVATDAACLLMVQPLNGKLKLNISDPTQTLTSININISWPGLTSLQNISVALPTGNYKGKSIVAYIDIPKVLPLNILKFTGKNELKNNKLQWTTAQEVNTDIIQILKIADDKQIAIIGEIKAKGNSGGVNYYEFNDYQNKSGTSYYQLKVIDKDGKATLSNIISIVNANNMASVYPNPVSKTLFIKNYDGSTIRIYNTEGKLILNTKTSNGELDISNYPTGTYYLKTMNQVLKFIVIR